MKAILIILLFLVGLTSSAQNKLAIIDSKDEFTNIYTGQGTTYNVIGKLSNEDLVYFEITDTTSDWYKVFALKGQYYNGYRDGFILKSRIKIIEQLPLIQQKRIIENILIKRIELADSLNSIFSKYHSINNVWQSIRDSIECEKISIESNDYSDIKYSPILEILPNYFCKTKDKETIQLFLDAMWSERGSANEMPSFTISDCFICQPDIILKQLRKIKNKEYHTLICDQIEWGLLNHYKVDENGKSENNDYNRLKIQLDKERNEASP